MALLIASSLAKEVAGAPLLRDVSFTLRRGERLTLSGRNGSGKTTLLRMLARESSIDGGDLVTTRGTRVALHDQRPPRSEQRSLREYVVAGA
ncbi:MAG: ATP-binding cassette domain-containing protein, partial [Thermoleophilaceae bacterium]|nr:ATP-binding cassette domain-containing protein [Thermoleophilaceae bacterium]